MPASMSHDLYRALVFAICALSALPVRADWINLSGAEVASNIAEITIEEDHVNVVIEIYIGDLETFIDLVPADWVKNESAVLPPDAVRMRRFATSGLSITTDKGEQLVLTLALAEARERIDRRSPFAGAIDPISRQRFPEPPADPRVLYAQLKYPFSQKPKTLTFTPPLNDDARSAVSIGFITYHKSVPVIDFRFLSGAEKLALDWSDPWYSKFKNPNLKRHHRDAMMSFLYVEPYEVRHEILTRVKDLEHLIDLGLRGKDTIEIDEFEPLKQRIGEFLLSRSDVRIDGRKVKAILDRSNYVKVGLKGIQIMDRPQPLEFTGAILGVLITYLTDELPQEVTVDWDLFTPQIRSVPAIAIDPAGPLGSVLTPEYPVHHWQNFLKEYKPPTVAPTAVAGTLPAFSVPVASLVCLVILVPLAWRARTQRARGQSVRNVAISGLLILTAAAALYPFAQVPVLRPAMTAPPLKAAQATQVIASLLKNIYRSFDFRDESDVYDKLATSVAGDLLADVYLQSRRSLIIEQAGGAQARIEKVEVREAEARGPIDGRLIYDVHAVWTAAGRVGHWGHVHQRQNLYTADLQIEAREGVWKLTGLTVIDEQRIDPAARAAAGAR
jgi:hypothetical protein